MATDNPINTRPGEDDLRRLLHQFNQPLTAIGNYAQAGCHMIDNGHADLVRLREIFEKIAQQSVRANAFSTELGEALTKVELKS